jgi:hypothetical protein
MRKINLVLLAVLSLSSLFAQTGGLKVNVTDSINNKIIFTLVTAFKEDSLYSDTHKLIYGEMADTNGLAEIKSIETGVYKVKAYYPGYYEDSVSGVIIKPNIITLVEMKMKASHDSLKPVHVEITKLQVIDKLKK